MLWRWYFDPAVSENGPMAWLVGQVVPPESAEDYLFAHRDSVLVEADFGSDTYYFDSSRYSCWQDAWALVDFVPWPEVPDYLKRHPEAELVWFEPVYPEKLSIWG